VNLVIEAHEHNYARCIHNGMNYVMLGGGGAGLTSGNDLNPTGYTLAQYKKEYDFARIEINGSVMNVTVLNANDNSSLDVIDSVQISK
jgi:hypothetical protein